MSTYGQYCPVAQALDVLGDRWTLLIIRDMMTGTRHFNDLKRGLPGISTGLLSKRLRQLQQAGIIEKRTTAAGRQTTAYHLTQAGHDLQPVIHALLVWGVDWAFGDPTLEQMDPLLLMWWMHDRVDHAHLPDHRVVIQFDF
ncbi:MAG: helix-turn-helix transcriptional regulator, partial [Chloroflexi bacterium]|nr:helix-turn-helix transcriptional regulator [Chloroflexota bacterium]